MSDSESTDPPDNAPPTVEPASADAPLGDAPLADAPLADVLLQQARGDGVWAYAGYLRRVAAAAIDGCLILVAIVVTVPINQQLRPAAASGLVVAVVMVAIASLLVVAVPSALLGSLAAPTTLGKRMCGVIVTDFRGQPADWGRAAVRIAARLGSLLTCVGAAATLGNDEIAVIVFVILIVDPFQASTPRRQALHDLIAGTLVLHRPLTRRPSPVADDAT